MMQGCNSSNPDRIRNSSNTDNRCSHPAALWAGSSTKNNNLVFNQSTEEQAYLTADVIPKQAEGGTDAGEVIAAGSLCGTSTAKNVYVKYS
jgi:hypothetical protein